MKKTSIKFLMFLCFLGLFIAGCKSAKPEIEEHIPVQEDLNRKLIKYDNILMWEINNTNSDGEDCKLYVLGTYHAGDERLLPFPEPVVNAIEAADRFCGELSGEDFASIQNELQKMVMNSMLLNLNHTLVDDLTEQEITLISQYIDPSDLATLICFEPWVLNTELQNIVIQASSLNPAFSYDNLLMSCIDDLNFDGLDDLQTQLDLMAYGNWDQQLVFLKDTLDGIKDLDTSVENMDKLYELFLSGNEQEFSDFYFADVADEISKNSVYAEYMNALLNERNMKWAERFNEYLSVPGTTFIFAGAAHFIGPDSVFKYMQKSGYLKN